MIRKLLKGFMIFVALAGVTSTLLPVATANAAGPVFDNKSTDSTGRVCKSSFLGFPAWYDGLPRKDGTCDISLEERTDDKDDSKTSMDLQTFIFTIVLNVIEIALRVVGFLAVAYIIFGGFKYLTSAGSADRITAGRKMIINALIGLVVSFMSVAFVNIIAGNIATTNGDACTAASSTEARVDANCAGIARVGAGEGITGILNSVYFAAGVIAVVVIIISAIFYVISQGDAAKIKRAKDGILYAIVGLVIVLMAFVITNYVIGRF